MRCYQRYLNRTCAICLVFTALSLSAGDQTFEAPAIGRFVLEPSVGKGLLSQCSRGTPRGVSSFWKPSSNDIAELEGALADYLEAREKAGDQVPPRGRSYHRQYVGFTRGSDRFIYGNFYPASAAAGFRKDKESSQPFGVCDGGPAFWGVVFRVATKKFEEISFNGLA